MASRAPEAAAVPSRTDNWTEKTRGFTKLTVDSF